MTMICFTETHVLLRDKGRLQTKWPHNKIKDNLLEKTDGNENLEP